MVWRRLRWRPRRDGGPDSERVLGLESELRLLRLEAAERERSLHRAQADLARERERARDQGDEAARADVQRLLGAIATPVVQLVTLAHLRDTAAAEARAGDALDIGMRLVRGLEDCGVQTSGAVGDDEPFDPGRHDPLSGTTMPRPGERAVVRFVGLVYRGRTVRKAGVEAAQG